MTDLRSPNRVADTPAEVLRRLASRAYRTLRHDCPTDRGDVVALLDEVGHLRRDFGPAMGGDLDGWFDQLEVQLARLLDGDGPEELHPRTEPSNCHEGCIA